MNLLVALTATLMLGQAPPGTAKMDSAVRARVVAPYLDPATVALGRVDLTRLDGDAVLNELTKGLPKQAQELVPLRAALREWQTAFLAAGGKELYAIVSLTDLPGLPLFVVVPIEAGADSKKLATLLTAPGAPLETAEVRGATLVVGAQRTVERLRTLKPASRPEVALAFAQASDMTGQILLVPPEHARRMLEEIYPTLPRELGGGLTRSLTRGFQWATLGVEAAPQVALRGVIQAENAAAAQTLADFRRTLIGLLLSATPSRGREAFQLATLLDQLKPTVVRDQLLLQADGTALLSLARTLLQDFAVATQRKQQTQSMRTLGLALHMYHDEKGSFPAVANFDKQGKPLLSWRVHLLPYLGQEALYKQFKLNEPWDSPHNRAFLERVPAVYRSASSKAAQGLATVVAPVHADFIFSGTPKGVRLQDIFDGTSNTILLAEVTDEAAMPWTKPEDWRPDKESPTRGLREHSGGTSVLLFADGSVRLLAKETASASIWAMLTRSRGEVITPP